MTGIIILAAGASTRLGQPKQQLQYNGKSLLQHAIEVAVATAAQPVIVVLGSGYNNINNSLQKAGITVVQHNGWQQGMAGSMQAGLREALLQQPTLKNIVITLCDQPFVTSQLLMQLVQLQHTSGKPIVASGYNNTVGPPVIFTNYYFTELLALKGEEGAKKIIVQHLHDVATLPFEAGKFDIDTQADYAALQQGLLQTNV